MDVPVGKEIDGFKILDVLGRGGMGVVYLAEDLALSRKVALKMIDPALAKDETFLRRFRAEARALARIDSPYIVRVHALRQTEIGLFIVMEYVDGGTIADPIADGPLPWQKALPLIKQMLHAFDHAHGVGVVHRDIKPRNIMLTPEGIVKVTDFGLAKVHQQNVEATVTQGIAGTLYYMAPEQVKGQQDLDHRADLYSLGMTIYEMLAGCVPLDRSEGEFAVLKRIVEEKFPPPGRYVRDLPDALQKFVMKSLEKDPARRHQSAREMLDDLAAFEASERGASGDSDEESGVAFTQAGRGSSRRSADASHVSQRQIVIGSAAALVVLFGIAGYIIFQGGFSSDRSALLSVTTMPEGVTVYVGDRILGETPLQDHNVDTGPLPLRLVKEGFVPLDTTLIAESARPLVLSVRLSESSASRTGTAVITSTPENAAVWINGTEVGRTPFTLESAPPGRLTIVLRKEGYADWEWQEDLALGDDVTLSASLQPYEREANGGSESSGTREPSATGTLNVSAEDGGPIAVDGRRIESGEPLALNPGLHRIVCGEPPDEATMSVRVEAGRSHEVTCYFRSTINVVATMADATSTWASIWVNGESFGLAPMELKLDPGTYRISVQRDGFEVLDEEKTVHLRPGFEPQTHPLSFRITKE